jgi:Xaa-Pro aminopeptidase
MPAPRSLPAALERASVSGWLIADYRGGNPVLEHVLGTPVHLTRRAFLLLTAGDQRLLVSKLDAPALEVLPDLPYAVDTYVGPSEVTRWLERHVAPLGRIAMEYSPFAELPAMSRVDGGTLEQVRAVGVEVVSSGDVFQEAFASWTPENLASHERSMTAAVASMESALAFIEERLRAGEACSEVAVQQRILQEFEQRGVVTESAPIVAANAASGDPHYEPLPGSDVRIARGDWILIDLWCREPTPSGTFADITWVAQAGGEVSSARREVFDTVAQARDGVIDALSAAHAAGTTLRGFELDRVARDIIDGAGYGEFFGHRTGHALSPGPHVHGLGTNLDDLETHDSRQITPGSGFTVEPGIYLAEFGVRSEINVMLGPDGPLVTAPRQPSPRVLDV